MKKEKKISKTRKIVGYTLLLVCAVFFIYCAAVLIYRLATVSDGRKWYFTTRFLAEFGILSVLSLPALDVCFGIFSWEKNRLLKTSGIIFRIVSCAICAIFIALGSAIVITGTITDIASVENVCVLGLAIDNKDRLPRDLERRLDKALEYRSDHPDKTFVVTGGNSEDPYYTEAAYMSRYLEEHGFDDSDKLVPEPNAKTTVENFTYTAELIDKEKPLGVITSDVHMFRATCIAKKQGYASVIKIPAPSEPWLYSENVMWESICAFFSTLGGKLAF